MRNVTQKETSTAGNPCVALTPSYGGTGWFEARKVTAANPRRGVLRYKILIVGLAVVSGNLAVAADYGWANTGTSAGDWHTVANWTNATGEVATEAPILAGCSAYFPYVDTTTRRVNLITAGYDYRTQAPVIDSVSGGEYWRLALEGGDNSWGRCFRSVKIANVNGFAGEWISYGTYQTLDLSNATTDQKFAVVYPNYQFPINVPDGLTAEIGYVRGSCGSLAKEGAGTLRIGTVMDAETTQIQLNGGTLELEGVIDAEDAIIKNAYYHLDANLPDTMETYTDDAGRTCVTKWFDANGSGRYAAVWDNSGDKTASHIKSVNAPFVTADASTTGLSVMDFGCATSVQSEYQKYGPTNCALRFDARMTNVREVLYVMDWNNGHAPAFGDSDGYSLVGSASYIFTYGTTITNGGGAFWQNAHYRAERPVVYNGKPSDNRYPTVTDDYSATATAMRLCDVKFGKDQRFFYIGSDRLQAATGGIRLGEALIFTNALTQAERQLVGDYLMKRWFAKRPQILFRNVYAADGTTIFVPAGRTAKIGNLIARGKLVKTGAGTLVVGRTVQDPNIEIRGGTVQFEPTTVATVTNVPAGTPQFWYDADQAGCFETNECGIIAWKDRRSDYATDRQATRFTYSDANGYGYPIIDTNSLAGHTVVTCTNRASFAMPTAIGGKYVDQQEAFIVFAFADADGAKNYNFLPNSSYTYVRGSSRILDPDCADDKAGGGIYTLDGVPGYVFESATGERAFAPDEWHVASVALTEYGGKLAGIARDGARTRIGRLKVGEVITYDSALTEDERRQTVAYLMKKWLGKDHPETQTPAVQPVYAFSFGSDEAAVIDAESDISIQSLTGGDGTLVKKGSGGVTIVPELGDDVRCVSVEGGSLTVAKPVKPNDCSAFHYDASDAASFTDYFLDGNGETNLNRWADVRANGAYAYKPAPFSPSSTNMFYTTNPIVRQATFPDGLVRPIVDCLAACGRNVNPPTGAGMYLSNASLFAKKICEAHYIFGDSGDTTLRVFHGESNSDFLRGTGRQLFRNGSQSSPVSGDIQNGYIAVNGQTTNSTYVLAKGKFYLVSVAPLAAKDISTIGIDRSNQSGGGRFGECIAFTNYLTAAERIWWQTHLMRKWIDADAPDAVWTNDIDSVSVADGATLTVQNGVIAAPTVTGGGTIAATKVAAIATLNLAVADRTTVECLKIDGVAGFAGAVAVKLSGADAARLGPGTYPLVTATSFANLDLTLWTLTPGQLRDCRFVLEGDSIVLKVVAPGTVMIVR